MKFTAALIILAIGAQIHAQAPAIATLKPDQDITFPQMTLPKKAQVMIVANQSSTTPYYWQRNGHVRVTCYGDSCTGYYRPPASGAQQIRGHNLVLLMPDTSIVIAECVGKVDIGDTIFARFSNYGYNDPDAPTVYRNCRWALPNTPAMAEFHKFSVKLTWREGTHHKKQSETYQVGGVLLPTKSN